MIIASPRRVVMPGLCVPCCAQTHWEPEGWAVLPSEKLLCGNVVARALGMETTRGKRRGGEEEGSGEEHHVREMIRKICAYQGEVLSDLRGLDMELEMMNLILMSFAVSSRSFTDLRSYG
eukprot:765173-Hanusia_phi.AAC.7